MRRVSINLEIHLEAREVYYDDEEATGGGGDGDRGKKRDTMRPRRSRGELIKQMFHPQRHG